MNSYIIPVDQSSHPNVSIELFDLTNRDLNNNSVQDAVGTTVEESGRRVVYIDDFTTSNEFGQDKKLTLEYLVKLNLDHDANDLKDLQYTMDIQVTPELDDDELKKLTGDEARMQARFTSSSKGCNDYRAFGRGGDGEDGLHLEIVVPSSIYKLNDVSDHGVDLVAVWACGHEGITLTHSIAFLPRIGSKSGSESVNGGGSTVAASAATAAGGEMEHGVANEVQPDAGAEQEAPLAEDTPNDIPDNYQAGEKLEKTLHHRHHEHDQEHEHEGVHVTKNQVADESAEVYKEEEPHSSHTLKKTTKTNVHPHQHHRHKDEEQPYQKIRKFNAKYNADDFGQAKFTANSYLTGLLVFIFIGGTVINGFLALSNRPRPNTAKTV